MFEMVGQFKDDRLNVNDKRPLCNTQDWVFDTDHLHSEDLRTGREPDLVSNQKPIDMPTFMLMEYCFWSRSVSVL